MNGKIMNELVYPTGPSTEIEDPSHLEQNQMTPLGHLTVLFSAIGLAMRCNRELDLSGHLDPQTLDQIKKEVLGWNL